MARKPFMTFGLTFLVAVMVFTAVPAAAQAPLKSAVVTTPDGVQIAAQEWGNPQGPEILFIHGFSQSHLSWSRQVRSELARDFRMVTYDVRGHGNSDKPTTPEFYKENKRWADEVQAVIDQMGLRKPVLVGWSYGGRIVNDYLLTHGTGRIAGVNFVAAIPKADPSLFGPGLRFLKPMSEGDLAANIDATKQFVRACFAKQPSVEDYETMVAFNMMVPPIVRGHMGGRPTPYEPMLRSLKIPFLVTHGTEDQLVLVGAAKLTASIVPGAKLSLYEGIGHATFWEDTPRFNKELAEFVLAANGR
jgi:non-heme chloroperoxidase